MKLKVFQKGFNYSQDGTGNRLVYHLQGCNMHCPWCSNPEGMAENGTLMVFNEFLIDDVCPHGAIRDKRLDRSICSDCAGMECVFINKNRGIRRSCEEYDIDTVIDQAKQSSALFFNGGGVTFSGGEPTMQFNALGELLRLLRKNHIHTAIETNATHPRLEAIFPFINLLIMDFKHYDSRIHCEFTGIRNEVIKSNLEKALQLHDNILIRIPLIKGFNASEHDAERFAEFLSGYDTRNAAFEFLPYHEYGKAKWLQCGMEYKMADSGIDGETLALFKKIFKENNLKVIHT